MSALSIHRKLLLIVVAAAVLPLVLAGGWLARGSMRAGEQLLRSELAGSLERIATRVGGEWVLRRSDLLLVGQNEPVRAVLGATSRSVAGADSARAYLESMRSQLDQHFVWISLEDVGSNALWTVGESAAQSARTGALLEPPFLDVRLPANDEYSGARLGTVHARVRLRSLLGDSAIAPLRHAIFSIHDRANGTVLFADSVAEQHDERWITETRDLEEPAIRLTMAAPLAPYVDPYRQSARWELVVLIAAAFGSIALTTVLMRRLTRSLSALTVAADAIARGELQHEVPVNGEDEVGRVARAFNTMTRQLRATLHDLARREALAAVGEFAAVLSHEIRNGHTSVKLDLQRAAKKMPDADAGKPLVTRALQRLERVDRSVAGSLALARSGAVHVSQLDLREPLDSAVAAASADGDQIHTEPVPTRLPVRGDAGALERLFTNLLFNAREAAGPGGRVELTVHAGANEVRVCVRDDGPGIGPDQLDHVFDPFFTTKRSGTGLGLAIARQIARAHHGEIRVLPPNSGGAEIEVVLPLSQVAADPLPTNKPTAKSSHL